MGVSQTTGHWSNPWSFGKQQLHAHLIVQGVNWAISRGREPVVTALINREVVAAVSQLGETSVWSFAQPDEVRPQLLPFNYVASHQWGGGLLFMILRNQNISREARGLRLQYRTMPAARMLISNRLRTVFGPCSCKSTCALVRCECRV